MPLTFNDLKNKEFLEATREFAASLLNIRFIGDGRAHCPFHQDISDSFRIYVNKNGEVRFHCFGACDGDWDVYDLIMRRKKCRFAEAQLIFAEYLGIEKIVLYKERGHHPNQAGQQEEPEDPDLETIPDELTDTHRQVMTSSSEFYRDLLLFRLDRFSGVLKYLAKRGVDEEIIRKFNIGYCPRLEDDEYKGRALLFHHLTSFQADYKTFTPFFETSLFRLLYDETSSAFGYYSRFIDFSLPLFGRYADYFTGRITFPVYGIDGNIVGIIGRRPDDRGLRWMKQTQEDTVINAKGWLYGIDKAVKGINENQTVILVEGIFDYFAFYNLAEDKDRTTVVATIGAKADPASLKLLRDLGAENFIIAYDCDPAGRHGAIDAVRHLKGSKVFFLGSLKEGEDPADKLKGVLGEVSNFAFRHLLEGMNAKSKSGKPVMASILTIKQEHGKVSHQEILIKPISALPGEADPKKPATNIKDFYYKLDDFLPLLTYDHTNRAELDYKLEQIKSVLTAPQKVQPPDQERKGYFSLPNKFIEDEVYLNIGDAIILHLRIAIEQQSRGRRIKETDSTIADWLKTSRKPVYKYKQELRNAGLLNIQLEGIYHKLSVKYFPKRSGRSTSTPAILID